MIVRQFLFWLRSAPAGERAEATAALARAYLYSDLSNDDLAAAEGAMTMLLDDPSPLVRAAMADVLAASEYAPASVIYALAADQPEIAVVILERSPLLVDAELVDAVATHGAIVQSAVARRAHLPRSVAAAIAEVGTPEACLELVENPGADIAPFSIERLVERFGHLAAIREVLLARSDLPASVRQALVATLSRTLAEFVITRDWLTADRAHRIAKEACEKATVALAASTGKDEVRPLIRHLRESGQLTAGLILRALLSGNMAMVEEALAELSGMTRFRVSALIQDRGGAGLRALYHKAGLPALAYPAFREAVATQNEDGFLGDPSGTARLKRRMIERVLTRCSGLDSQDIEPLMLLLRRFATEAAREEARMLCDDLVDEMTSQSAAWQNNAEADAYADDIDASYDVNAGYEVAQYNGSALHDAAANYDAASDLTNGGYASANYNGAVYGRAAPGGAGYTPDSGRWDEVFPEFDGAHEGHVEYSNTNDHFAFDDVWDGTQNPAANNQTSDYNTSRYAA